MELRQLRYYVAIVDHGSLSRAARVLHIAQPALTQQIQNLEVELGAKLLHRSAQGVLATDTGKTFYEHALAILKQVDDAKAAVAQTTSNPTGSVALGMPQSVSGALALPLLKAVRETYPEITLQLTEELSGNLFEQLRSGRLNLAVLFDDGQLTVFEKTPLVEETMMFITCANSRFGITRSSIPLAKVVQLPLILPSLQHGVRPRIENVVRANTMALTNVIEINSVAILKSALLADLGVTILPTAPFLSEIERGLLSAYPITGATISRTIALCSSKNIPLTDAASAVERLVIDVTADLCRLGTWPGAHALGG
ncbi:MAG: LysR substrate-binding domain-containing protein [Pseudomonadota bacterium]